MSAKERRGAVGGRGAYRNLPEGMARARMSRVQAFLLMGMATLLLVLLVKPELTGLVAYTNPGQSYSCTAGTGLSFLPAPTGQVVTAQGNVTEIYLILNNSDNRTVNFSIDVSSQGKFSSISMTRINDTVGLANFTPAITEIHEADSTVITLLVVNTAGETLCFNNVNVSVLNENDVPNITRAAPASPTTVAENASRLFNVTVHDFDQVYGDNLTLVWRLNGSVQSSNIAQQAASENGQTYTTQTWTYAPGFCDAGSYAVLFRVNDSAGTQKNTSWALTVTNTNRLPQQNTTLPVLNLTEDINVTAILNLTDYFYDLDARECNNSVTYSVTMLNGSASDVNVSLDGATVNVTLASNWCGSQLVRFSMNDSSAASSANTSLVVTCTGDAPFLPVLVPQNVSAFTDWSYTVGVTDNDIGFGDVLNLSLNSSRLNVTNITISSLNSTHFTLSASPVLADLGHYDVLLNVSDSFGLRVAGTLGIWVKTNRAPYFTDRPLNTSLTIYENVSIQVNVTDPDADAINFTLTGEPSCVSVNATGFVGGDCGKADIGNYSINLSATDIYGAVNRTSFHLELRNVWEAPVLASIGSQQTRVGRMLTFTVNATDPDLPVPGDNLTFEVNDSSFTLSQSGDLGARINRSSAEGAVYFINVSATDAHGNSDSELVLVNFTDNHAPVIGDPGPQNLTEKISYSLQLSITDTDGDSFNVSGQVVSNTSFPNFSVSSTGLLSFTPQKQDVNNHTVNLTVSDALIATTISVFFGVAGIDNAPVLTLIGSVNGTEGTLLEYLINATDEEGDALAYNVTFLNSSPPFFAISDALINFTPGPLDVGVFAMNVSIHQVSIPSQHDWEIVNLTIGNVNNAPNLTLLQPNGSVSIQENHTVTFNASVEDLDLTVADDALTFQWLLDHEVQVVNVSNVTRGYVMNISYAYWADWLSNGSHLVELNVSDQSTTIYRNWSITVDNVDRLPVFGVKSQNTAALLGWEVNNLNATGRGLELRVNDSAYVLQGNATATVIDFHEDTYVTYGALDVQVQGNDSRHTIAPKVRVSDNNITWDGWSPVASGRINISHQRYLQLAVQINTTADNSTPRVTGVTYNYHIANASIGKDTVTVNWIDLDDFFIDEDADAQVVFSAVNTTQLQVLISNTTHKVTFIPASGWSGAERIRFVANDSGNEVYSNYVLVEVTDSQGSGGTSEVTVVSSGGGGGGGSMMVPFPKEVKRNVSTPVYLDMIVPEEMTVYDNDTIIVPVRIVNTVNMTLQNVTLRASTEKSGVALDWAYDALDEMEPYSAVMSTLIVTSFKAQGSYEIVLTANVSNPPYQASSKMFLNTYHMGEHNGSQVNTRIAFARDLLASKSECLELTESLQDAQKAIAAGEIDKANALIEASISACNFLSDAVKENLAQPRKEQASASPQEPRRVPWWLLLVPVAVIALLVWLLRHRHARHHPPRSSEDARSSAAKRIDKTRRKTSSATVRKRSAHAKRKKR